MRENKEDTRPKVYTGSKLASTKQKQSPRRKGNQPKSRDSGDFFQQLSSGAQEMLHKNSPLPSLSNSDEALPRAERLVGDAEREGSFILFGNLGGGVQAMLKQGALAAGVEERDQEGENNSNRPDEISAGTPRWLATACTEYLSLSPGLHGGDD